MEGGWKGVEEGFFCMKYLFITQPKMHLLLHVYR